ncbi:HAD family hydrolase [Saccharopolyspora sp. HNM0983]|uniref:HAD family hydrolase n=1 Tax=Saccharopolyspora montiporae TaxID=2781240 RepID=A0A929B6E5_9PSEU|nr:HAD family hydrolase [Saccharopolyspora sp. HNM0983]MBE9373111.1 HAD family hydrolase [Saccharopolyspora sp. HNM0983]
MPGTQVGTRTRHVVWDWNGTLLDDNHAVVAAVNAVCAEFDREQVDLQEWRSVFSRPLHQCYERLLRRSLSDQDWARIDLLYHRAYRDLLHTCGLADGVPTALRGWADAGGSQSLLSMWFHDELVPLVAEMGLHELFDRVDGLRQEIGGGSKAEHLRHHLAQQELDPREVVLIGDVLDDAVAAQRAGAECVLVSTGVMAAESLRDSGFPVVGSVAEALDVARTG